MKKNTCNIVRDLLPLYVDDILSEESRCLVEEHMKSCEACREEYRTISAEVQIPMDVNVNPMKKVKRMIVKRVVITVMAVIVLCGAFLIANMILIPMDYEKYDLKNVLKVTEKEDGFYLVCMGGTSVATYMFVLPEDEASQEVGEDGKRYVDYYVYIESALINQMHIVLFQKEYYMTDMETEDSVLTTYKRIGNADDEDTVIHRVYYDNMRTKEQKLIWENPEVDKKIGKE